MLIVSFRYKQMLRHFNPDEPAKRAKRLMKDSPNKAAPKGTELWRGFSLGTRDESRNITEHPELYYRYRAMIARCSLPSDPDYRYYGARGIQVCDEWVLSFNAYVGCVTNLPGYSLSLTIDRKDNDGHYEPGNVRWATRKEQNENKRPYV